MSFRDVVIILPGISGSVLTKDGQEVWGTSSGAIWRAITTKGESIRKLALASKDDPNLDDLGDGVQATGLIPDLHVIPGLWKIDGYSGMKKRLQEALKLEPNKNFFDFPYDWRRDNRVSARRLQRLCHEWLKNWRESSGHTDAKLILIGHSMGGLVARYFLENLQGWRETRSLITFGAPYRGSLNALGFLANGYAKNIGPLDVDFSVTLRTFTAVYQLLPIFECVDIGEGPLKRVNEVRSITNVDADRSSEALAFHREIRDAQTQNAQQASYREAGYEIYPIVGIFQPTFQSAQLRGGKVTLLRTYNGLDEGGDGIVPRVSATPIELSSARREIFVAEAHASLQNWQPTLVQVIGVLQGETLNLAAFEAVEMATISLDLDDVYPADAVEIRAKPPYEMKVTATVTRISTGASQELPLAPAANGVMTVTTSLPPDSYRITVAGQDVTPVTDTTIVL